MKGTVKVRHFHQDWLNCLAVFSLAFSCTTALAEPSSHGSAALAYLELMQKEEVSLPDTKAPSPLISPFQHPGAVVPEGRLLEFNKRFQEYFEKVRKTPLLTKYEDPLLYYRLMEDSKQIEGALATLKIPLPIHPLIGTLKRGGLNARSLRVCPLNEYMVIFHRLLIGSSINFARLVASVSAVSEAKVGAMLNGSYQWESNNEFDFLDEQKLKDALHPEENPGKSPQENPQITAFQRFMIGYLVEGRDVKISAPEGQGASIMVGTLAGAMLLFIMAHEYAHIVRGHVDVCETEGTDINASPTIEQVIRSQEQELEADIYGALLVATAVKNGNEFSPFGIKPVLWGMDVLFTWFDFIERGISVLNQGDDRADSEGSHPPARTRRDMFREAYRSTLGKKEANAALFPAYVSQIVLERFWLKTVPMLKGKKLSPLFTVPSTGGASELRAQ